MHFDGTIWRPPYEAASLLIQVTAGCTHHSCKFCTLYEDLPFKFRMSPPSEVEEDLAAVSRYCQDAPWFRVFFTGANPFVLTTGEEVLPQLFVHWLLRQDHRCYQQNRG